MSTKPYLTTEIKTLIKERDRLYKLTKKYPQNLDIMTRFKYLNKDIFYKIRHLDRQHIKEKFNESKGNGRKTWKTINSIIYNKHPNDNKTTTIKEICINGIKETDELKIANVINDYFISVGQILNTGNRASVSTYIQISDYTTSNTFNFKATTADEIFNLLKSLQNKSSTSFDNISTKLV